MLYNRDRDRPSTRALELVSSTQSLHPLLPFTLQHPSHPLTSTTSNIYPSINIYPLYQHLPSPAGLTFADVDPTTMANHDIIFMSLKTLTQVSHRGGGLVDEPPPTHIYLNPTSIFLNPLIIFPSEPH